LNHPTVKIIFFLLRKQIFLLLRRTKPDESDEFVIGKFNPGLQK